MAASRYWFAALALMAGLVAPTLADDLPTFTITFTADGTIDPPRIEVPAGRFKLVLINQSKDPVEFESLPLRKEKVLGPGVKSFVVLSISRPAEYPFFDDFHQDARGTLVVLPNP
ncbi:cupredoxin-domain containing protein [Pollutimonas nitritireducens]|uniref:Cupredoxin-domain containing protein n=1 Tax=Pollutimonas nitritireducens TaxID=2045209 RepID=A0A2N4UJK3_9BURK|nr:cupredoxin domain-containing protein [Pollutimonas nitritireducens]PLC55165.1 cupredoxin-domain containing protein [Pollutimonas nitritireducens]